MSVHPETLKYGGDAAAAAVTIASIVQWLLDGAQFPVKGRADDWPGI